MKKNSFYSLSLPSSLTSSFSLERLGHSRHSSGSTAVTALEPLETRLCIFFYFALVPITNIAFYVNVDVLFDYLYEMLLLVATIKNKHII